MIEGVRMEYSKRFSGNDELRMRFTVWLKIVVKRVKIDYIRRQKKRYIEVSIEEAAITNTLTYEQQFDINENSNKFIFENSRISAAFNKLSSKRKEILEMLFVRNLTSDEIAKECQERLNSFCQEQYQKYEIVWGNEYGEIFSFINVSIFFLPIISYPLIAHDIKIYLL